MSSPLPLFRPRRRPPLAGLLRAARWHRRKLAVLAAIGAVLCTLAAIPSQDPHTVPVVVAARDLTGGQPLGEADLRIARYPADLAPTSTIAQPDVLVGRHLISSAGAGTPLTDHAVIAPRGLQAGVGMALVPIRLDDAAVAALLRVGDRVDVVASPADGSPARIIAAGSRVLALPANESSGGPLGTVDSRGPLLLLEVSPADAPDLIQAQARDRLSVVLR